MQKGDREGDGVDLDGVDKAPLIGDEGSEKDEDFGAQVHLP